MMTLRTFTHHTLLVAGLAGGRGRLSGPDSVTDEPLQPPPL